MNSHDNNISHSKPFVVGISGGSAAGKTMVAGLLRDTLADYSPIVVEVDRYFHDQSHLSDVQRSKINYDIPTSLHFDRLVRDINLLINWNETKLPVYDYKNHCAISDAEQVLPSQLIIVEGILLFHPPAIASLIDFRIFVDAESDERLRRRIARDTTERGRTEESILRQFNETVEPAFIQYTLPTRKDADFLLDWNLIDMAEIRRMTDIIRGTLNTHLQ